jgi:putative transposase
MPYWKLYYHIVWGTKDRQPLLTPDVEPVIYGFIRSKVAGLEGSLYAANGWLDHVHLVVSIPPKIAVAAFIGQVKGVTTARYNKSEECQVPIHWQEEYSVFSFDQKRLPNFVDYVERQKIHHAQGTTIKILEYMDPGEVHKIGEEPADYFTA